MSAAFERALVAAVARIAWLETPVYYDPGSLASRNWKSNTPQRSSGWYRKPLEGAYVVCVQKTLRWRYNVPTAYNPAFITVKEILDDAAFKAYNQTVLPPLISATANASGVTNPSKIPCLFFEYTANPSGPNERKYGVAFTPNAVNLQWVDSNPMNPKPFGPRNSQSIDVLEQAIQTALPGTSLFLDNWKFHIAAGEVHCGSAAEREGEAAWWAK